MPGLAEFDSLKDNPLQQIAELKRRIDALERWAAPVGLRQLPNPPGIQAWRTTAQSITNNLVSPVTALTDTLNEEGLELESGNVIKLRRDSEIEYYLIWAHAEWAANSTGFRSIRFDVRNINSGSYSSLTPVTKVATASPDKTHMETTLLYRMATTDDAIRFSVYQNSGGALNLNLFLVNAIMVKSLDAISA